MLPSTHRQHPPSSRLQANTCMGRVRAPHASCRPPRPSFHRPALMQATRVRTGLPPANTQMEDTCCRTQMSKTACPQPTTAPQSETVYM
jgi:hypothetical protein